MKGFLLFLVLISLGMKAVDTSDKIAGVWLNEDKSSKVEFYKVENTYSGRIVWISDMERKLDEQPKDKNNPNPELRNRNLIGMDIITGLKYSSCKWINGTIYTPRKGIYASCNVELLSNGQLKIVISKSMFKQTQTWTRQ